MKQIILTDNFSEKIKLVFDGTGFAFVKEHRNGYDPQFPVVIKLNPKEFDKADKFYHQYKNEALINTGYGGSQ